MDAWRVSGPDLHWPGIESGRPLHCPGQSADSGPHCYADANQNTDIHSDSLPYAHSEQNACAVFYTLKIKYPGRKNGIFILAKMADCSWCPRRRLWFGAGVF